MRILRKPVSILLALILVFTAIPVTMAGALTPISYVERSWNGSAVVSETGMCSDYTDIGVNFYLNLTEQKI